MKMKKKSFRIDYEGEFPPSMKDMQWAIDKGCIDDCGMVKITEIEEDELQEVVREKIKKIKNDRG